MTKQHIFIMGNNLQKIGQSFFHLSHRTTMIQDLLVRRQFSLVPDNRTNFNVETCYNDLSRRLFVCFAYVKKTVKVGGSRPLIAGGI
jgi:hypothetical protein